MEYILSLGLTIILLTKCAYADDTATPNPLCPYPSEEFTRSPYQGDCTKYWECYEGQRYPMSCPDGMEFNAQDEVCDFPEIANCDNDATVTYPTYPHTTATTPGTGTTLPTTTVWTPDPICPYPSDQLTFVPHPTNCSLYWECYQGIKYLMACPGDLVFNVDSNFCDTTANVDCSRTSTTDMTTTTVTTAAPDDNICSDKEDGTFLSDPDDCSKFYECLYGKAIEGNCPLDLLWNEKTLTCDYPENVVCFQ